MPVRPSSATSTIGLVMTCLVSGVPSSYLRVVVWYIAATASAPWVSWSEASAVITACARCSPMPS